MEIRIRKRKNESLRNWRNRKWTKIIGKWRNHGKYSKRCFNKGRKRNEVWLWIYKNRMVIGLDVIKLNLLN